MNSYPWSGLLYPDLYVIKYFFKNGMDRSPGSVLELGCGNGNNLKLFRDFGWRSVGLDNSAEAIGDARSNFDTDDPSSIEFHQWDLNDGLPHLEEDFDVLLVPNSAYYIDRHALAKLLTECRGVLREGASYMLSWRSTSDWRFGRGRQAGENAFILETDVTGDMGAQMTFYEPEEMVALIESQLGPIASSLVLSYDYQNLQRGEVIDNHDFIIWGSIA